MIRKTPKALSAFWDCRRVAALRRRARCAFDPENKLNTAARKIFPGIGPRSLWGPGVGRLLPQKMAVRQEGAIDSRRQLHGIVLLGDLRQGRDHRVGGAEGRLPRMRTEHARS